MSKLSAVRTWSLAVRLGECEQQSFVDKDIFKKEIEAIFNDFRQESRRISSLKRAETHLIGSAATNLRTKSSDIDILIKMQQNGTMIAFRQFMAALKRDDQRFILQSYVRNARVPVIRVQHRTTGHLCDITFDCPAMRRDHVLQNTKLLKTYQEISPSFGTLFKFIKFMWKKTPVFSNRTGGLSSYAHAIVLLHYLIHHEDFDHINPETFHITKKKRELKSNGQILINYLTYMATEFKDDAIDIRSIRIEQKSDFQGSLTIIDPYEESRDLAVYISEVNKEILRKLAEHWIMILTTKGNHFVPSMGVLEQEIDKAVFLIKDWKKQIKKELHRGKHYDQDEGITMG